LELCFCFYFFKFIFWKLCCTTWTSLMTSSLFFGALESKISSQFSLSTHCTISTNQLRKNPSWLVGEYESTSQQVLPLAGW
jgi:hypothetical protein